MPAIKFSIFALLPPALLIAFSAILTHAFAAEAPARCYRFTTTNVPDRSAHVIPRTSLWCYQKISTPPGGMYIYNADNSKVRPELALVKTANGTLTHGSLLKGKLTMHSVRASQYNPFSVPLAEPSRIQAYAPPPGPEFTTSTRTVLAFLLLAESPSPADLTVTPGTENAVAEIEPWRGFWWPNKGLPMVAPLLKYDQFVKARTDSNPSSAAWEAAHHGYDGVWWEGHCNGWAASTILRPEPSTPRKDPVTGVVFTVGDQKGLLAEVDFCANTAMFGKRYYGNPGDDINDVDPVTFHNTISYYIGKLHKPIAMDYRRDATVDNHVVSGYTMNIEQSGPGVLTVTTVLRMHAYDFRIVEEPGIAPPYARTYKYNLIQDASGNVTGGQWITENPDFLWAPLSPGKCRANNQNLEEDYVEKILGL